MLHQNFKPTSLNESEEIAKVVYAPNPHPDFKFSGTTTFEQRGKVDLKAHEAEVRQKLANPETNPVLKVFDNYSRTNLGKSYDHEVAVKAPTAETHKNIGIAYQMAVTGHSEYKQAVFKAYQEKRPDIINQLGATNYDELVSKSYHSMSKETSAQFDHLPVRMQYHSGGYDEAGGYDPKKDLSYKSSGEMLTDVVKNGNLTVFRGGDEHEFLKGNDYRGLNPNEKFRAVHDIAGHGIHSNPFGQKGEEIAWDAHRKLYTPGAQVAMTSETRGQQGYVHFSGVNDKIKARMDELKGWRSNLQAEGKPHQHIDDKLVDVGRQWKYAPQKSIALPPEMLDPHYDGHMPEYLKGLSTEIKEAVSFLDSEDMDKVDEDFPDTHRHIRKIHDSVFGEGNDTIEIPIDRSGEAPITHSHLVNRYEHRGSIGETVADAVNSVGYRIHDYVKGEAIKKDATDTKNLTSIAKVLNKKAEGESSSVGEKATKFMTAPKYVRNEKGEALNADGNPVGTHGGDRLIAEHPRNMTLTAAYNADSLRKAKNGDHVVVISRNKYDVAGMTTNQNWHSKSCMEMHNGCNREYLPRDTENGTLAAYLTTKDHKKDPTIQPMGRILLKNHEGTRDGHDVFIPESKSYGVETQSFRKAVEDFSAKHYPMKPN